MNINWSFCSGPVKLGVTGGQVDCYGSREWNIRRVARLGGRKVFAARVGSHADGRGCFLLDVVLLFGASAYPGSCSGGRATAPRRQQGGAGVDDTVWCHEAGVCGAGDEG